jgi:pSer/pThr/pTyr-binding forkhead associated (FHA) protein
MNAVPSIQPRLVVLQGEIPNEKYAILEGPNWIGRLDQRSVDIDLGHQEPPDKMPLVSPEHARITFENNQLFIEDVGSANGTSVNGERLDRFTRYPLPANAIIQIGTVLLQVRM